jgi:hypothetical protein
MSEFRLSDVAGWLGKDERTLRRWCIAGMVPSAFLTAGGHWRIRAEHPRKVRIVHKGFRPRNRGVQKALSDQLRKTRAFHARGRGKCFIEAVGMISARVDQLSLPDDDRDRLRDGLMSVVDAPLSVEVFESVMRVAVRIWEDDRRRLGLRGEMGAARVAGIPRTTFRLHFSRYLVAHESGEVDWERCQYPDHATDDELRRYRSAHAKDTKHRDDDDGVEDMDWRN